MALRHVFMPTHLLLPGWARISATLRGVCPPYPDCGPYGLPCLTLTLTPKPKPQPKP